MFGQVRISLKQTYYSQFRQYICSVKVNLYKIFSLLIINAKMNKSTIKQIEKSNRPTSSITNVNFLLFI